MAKKAAKKEAPAAKAKKAAAPKAAAKPVTKAPAKKVEAKPAKAPAKAADKEVKAKAPATKAPAAKAAPPAPAKTVEKKEAAKPVAEPKAEKKAKAPAVAEVVEPTPKKKEKKAKVDKSGLSEDQAKWHELHEKYQTLKAPSYSISGQFEAKTPIQHKIFGWGFILSNEYDRLEVLFEDGKRMLISNRQL
jgi:hypothetical protein